MNAGETQRLTRVYEADAATVPAARRLLAEFAAAAGASREQVDAVRLAASEALTNAVLHAYRGRPGKVYVSAALAGGELWVLVGDDGSGLHAGEASSGLGIGLVLIADLSDSFSIVNRSSGGTEVRMRFKIESADRPSAGPSMSVSGSSVQPLTRAAVPATT